MKKLILISSLLILFIISSLSFGDSPYVKITSPSGGWSTKRKVNITGETNVNTKAVTVVYNGIPLRLPVSGGRFARTFIAGPGMNQIYVEAQNETTIAKDSVSFYSNAPSKAMKIVLSWDTDKTDVDLWVIEPTKEKCYYGYKNTKIGGSLDVDVTTGYGPEIYTLAAPTKGAYKIQVKYYSDNGYPQTELKVYVVMYEGTENEIIKEYTAMLTKTGEIVTVDVVNLE